MATQVRNGSSRRQVRAVYRPSPKIHGSAVISAQARFGPSVEIGAFTVIEGAVRLARGCAVHASAWLAGPLVMGVNNRVFGRAAIGGPPQDFKYQGASAGVRVGAGNTFHERVTVHCGMSGGETRIGNDNLLLASAHLGHDCRLGDGCVLGVGALLAGHVVLEDGVHIGDGAAVHQFCRVGRLSALRGGAFATQDVPPFVVVDRVNAVVGVNTEGMNRAGFSQNQLEAVQRLFQIVYCEGLTLPNALAALDEELGASDVVREFISFARNSSRGIVRRRVEGAAEKSARSPRSRAGARAA